MIVLQFLLLNNLIALDNDWRAWKMLPNIYLILLNFFLLQLYELRKLHSVVFNAYSILFKISLFFKFFTILHIADSLLFKKQSGLLFKKQNTQMIILKLTKIFDKDINLM